ncbi:hypothetical protein A3A38_00980 [Candidatus Kaiserbacteria bacterium RIFCSPLOWO2_01_FULL_53_17]|uniref:DNA polymerase III subunit delta n=1 Tax=Candidatus Kaiserbacteria bacterium RIFCSPLOWO2_01_FULL_53_17 TaxID=1798511 RepID=A0A1F6EHA4_9BACT|nr:MAG: hypothetical protein A3A38_00980 [Candidatus Kaiserbacteria bacterium RIFCSPLOWO2_01_FULL_53_17]
MQYVGAYLVQGDASILDVLIAKLMREGCVEKGSPDLYVRTYRSFGIDEARALRERAQRKSISSEGRVFAIFVPGMTSDAQNALLKVLEEPPARAVFFFVVPSPETLLSTLRSRMQMMMLPEGTKAGALLVDADDFLGATPQKRFEMLKPLYEHDEDEGRDMGAVVGFLQALERRFAQVKEPYEKKDGLEAIYRARKFAGDKGSLLKALLEQMALLMPKL